MDDFNKYDKYNNQNNSWNYTPGNNPDQYSYSYYKL